MIYYIDSLVACGASGQAANSQLYPLRATEDPSGQILASFVQGCVLEPVDGLLFIPLMRAIILNTIRAIPHRVIAIPTIFAIKTTAGSVTLGCMLLI